MPSFGFDILSRLPAFLEELPLVVLLHCDNVFHFDTVLVRVMPSDNTVVALCLVRLLEYARCGQIGLRVHRVLYHAPFASILLFGVYHHYLVVLEDVSGMVLSQNRQHNVELLPVLFHGSWALTLKL